MQTNPMEYLRIFFRRKWLIIVPMFVGLVLGVCSGIIMPKKYMSTTRIQIQEGKADNPLFDKLAVSSQMEQRAKAVRERMLSWGSLVEVVKRLKMDRQAKTPYEFERIVVMLREEIAFSIKGANIIQVSYVSTDPVLAQALVQNIMQIFVEDNVTAQNKETADAIKFIEEQLTVYRGKIKSSEIAKLKDQLNLLLVDSTESHPKVKELREQIAYKMEELKKENLEYSEDVRLSAESTKGMLDEIKKALNTVNRSSPTPEAAPETAGDDFYKVMLIDKMDNVMARDVGVNESIYNSLLQRLETAKITQRLQASKEGMRYIVLDPPRIPHLPIQPNKLFNALIGFLLGLAAGAAVVFIMEFLDKSFLDVQEAQAYFGAPVLGAISRITTAEDIEESRQKQVWFLFWMASSGVLAIAFTIMIAAFIKV